MFVDYFCMTYFNITLPFKNMASKWSLPFRLHNQNFVCISHISRACHMPHLLHSVSVTPSENSLTPAPCTQTPQHMPFLQCTRQSFCPATWMYVSIVTLVSASLSCKSNLLMGIYLNKFTAFHTKFNTRSSLAARPSVYIECKIIKLCSHTQLSVY